MSFPAKVLLILCATALGLAAAVASPGGRAAAGERCDLGAVVNGYREAVLRLNAKDYDRALISLSPLADAGLGPAQRVLAEMYAEGRGVGKSSLDAALWAELAFRSGDEAARRLSRDYRAALDASGRRALDQRLGVWRAAGLVCDGAHPRAEADAAFAPLEFAVEMDQRVKPDVAEEARSRLPTIVQAALDQDGMARTYLSVIDGFEFHTGGQYHRYVGWHPRAKANVMRVATNSFNDDSNEYVARAILLEAKRRVYERLPNAEFADPLMREIGGMKVFGSVYPDIRNGTFFRLMRQALDMADRLPAEVRRYVDIIDEVHYSPISKHYKKYGTLDAQGAYYNKILSAENHRIIFVRRDVLYSSPLYLLQTFVHEGTHAVQDQKAYDALVEVERLKAELRRLTRAGKAQSAEAFKIERRIEETLDYPKRWYQGVETDQGRVPDIAFECEATEVEIAAIKAVSGPPDVMEASGYLKLCPEAQRQLVRWKEELLKAGRR